MSRVTPPRCRICHGFLPEPFLDFGAMPLANAFVSSPEEAVREERFPLAVTACRACGLVQLNAVVSAERMYRNYVYVTSTSEAVKTHARQLATALVGQYGWDGSRLLVEVASNDGTVLKQFQQAGMRVLGIEPALNIAAMAEADGVPTVAEFFNAATAARVLAAHGPAAGIVGRHVFAHIDDVHDFLNGVNTLLADDGVLVIEIPYLGDLFSHLEFDTIYHEHLSYFSLAPLTRLFREHGLAVVDVERITLHGGSIVLHVRRQRAAAVSSPRVGQLFDEEQRLALTAPQTLERFAASVWAWRDRFAGMIADLRRDGARLIGYGAAAKANTLLNYCSEAAEALECVLDRNPLKHGRYTPGTYRPVVPVERWADSGATHMVVLAWNFKDEIMRQMQPFARGGGRFIIPIPEPSMVDGFVSVDERAS